MTGDTKNMINVILDLLSETLKSTNTVAGVMIDKKDFTKSKLIFLDFENYKKGIANDGFSVEFDELNKGVFLKEDKQ